MHYYAYAFDSTIGRARFYAFHDWQSRDGWIAEDPNYRFKAYRADMTRAEHHEAIWWTDQLIGATDCVADCADTFSLSALNPCK